jgi:hypothetical protein
LVEKEVAFSAIKLLQAVSLKKHYDNDETNLLIIDDKDPFKLPYKKTTLYQIKNENGIQTVYKSKTPTFNNFFR